MQIKTKCRKCGNNFFAVKGTKCNHVKKCTHHVTDLDKPSESKKLSEEKARIKEQKRKAFLKKKRVA